MEILEQRCRDCVTGREHRSKRTQHGFIRAEFISRESRLCAIKSGSIEIDGLVFLVNRADEDVAVASDAGSASGDETSRKGRVGTLEGTVAESNMRVGKLEETVAAL